MGLASSQSYFCMPARSAWPGQGRVSLVRASGGIGVGGSGDILAHFGHSVLPTMIATGDPRLAVPDAPRTVTSSASNFMRAPRPTPSRRRARAARMSSEVTLTWAGMPSIVATRAGPWDSPAVR
jgi:hypothetical protein